MTRQAFTMLPVAPNQGDRWSLRGWWWLVYIICYFLYGMAHCKVNYKSQFSIIVLAAKAANKPASIDGYFVAVESKNLGALFVD